MGILCFAFVFAVLSAPSRFAIISRGKRELVTLLQLCSCCRVAVSVLCLFLAVPWLVYKFKRTVGKPYFSDQFKKIIKRYKKVEYSMDSMRQVVNPITVF